MSRKYRTLTQELEELERTDPKVREAARRYDEMVKKILEKPAPPKLDNPKRT